MADQVNLLFKGRNPQERTDLILDDGLHLRLRAGDVVGLTRAQADWVMNQRYRFWFRESDEEPRPAVDSTDVQHSAHARGAKE